MNVYGVEYKLLEQGAKLIYCTQTHIPHTPNTIYIQVTKKQTRYQQDPTHSPSEHFEF